MRIVDCQGNYFNKKYVGRVSIVLLTWLRIPLYPMFCLPNINWNIVEVSQMT